jgi:hypothetical protein
MELTKIDARDLMMRDIASLSWVHFVGIVLATLAVAVVGGLLRGGPGVSTTLAVGAALAVPLCALAFWLVRRHYAAPSR